MSEIEECQCGDTAWKRRLGTIVVGGPSAYHLTTHFVACTSCGPQTKLGDERIKWAGIKEGKGQGVLKGLADLRAENRELQYEVKVLRQRLRDHGIYSGLGDPNHRGGGDV